MLPSTNRRRGGEEKSLQRVLTGLALIWNASLLIGMPGRMGKCAFLLGGGAAGPRGSRKRDLKGSF